MPTTPSRSNSMGANGRIRAHVPFRGNDLEHGKKTGKTVTQVSRDADDFEPFDQVLGQAYQGNLNPPRVANKKTKSARNPSPEQDEDYDNSGEVSMDIDSAAPSSARRAGSSSRPLPASSTVDYDRIPSPKPNAQRSSAKPNGGSKPKTPSGLRSQLHFEDDVELGRDALEYPMDDSFAGDTTHANTDYGGEDQSFENDQPSMSHSNLSFTELARDEEDNLPNMSEDDDDEEEPAPSTSRGKQRSVQQESDGEDHPIEDEIADVMDAIDQEPEEDLPPSKPIKKTRKAPPTDSEPPKKRPRKGETKKDKKQPRINNIDENGLRRSKRQHYAPLEYWRGEHVVYGRREHGKSVVPVIKEIIRFPKPEPELLGTAVIKRRKRYVTRPPRSKIDNPELGWDDETQPNGIIMDYQSQSEVERRVAFPARLVNPKPGQGDKFAYHKIFGDGNFVAAGQLIIPPGAEKPTKPTKDNTYIFYIIEGAVECKIHRTSFVLSTGGSFMVPRGNQYYIKNICERDVKLFFAQARKVPPSEMEAPPTILAPRSSIPPRTKTAPQATPEAGSTA
ncbi:hypothetical protein M422DRAFT_180332 [Sphaerobolus stellatus SS14]|uniref:CENP-C homolog n=1 Tax=Sphaerobolus stellatus (strain SS14) TaxID=990650 RepID=A0A0C9ULG3_SPHS4|nr:hypothetical protein M422DRAFT_192220 [Sphaerobolus stellatus SS14]KIJ35724.1 hypothetical protein M422DRAFT_180332 [Sphaerobolus stellatus SS14]